MDPEQQKKWKEKLRKAKALDAEKSVSGTSDASKETANINEARRKFRSSHSNKSKSAADDDIDVTPNQDVEDDIVVEVTPTKALTDNPEETVEDKKVVIKSKSKGTKGFQG